MSKLSLDFNEFSLIQNSVKYSEKTHCRIIRRQFGIRLLQTYVGDTQNNVDFTEVIGFAVNGATESGDW